MRGAWLEDMLSVLPPIAFLVATRVRYREPSAAHPFGLHRAVEIAFLAAALALLMLGFFLVVDSVLTLLAGEHPPIGMVELFDSQVWLGWLMIAALLYSAVPVVVLGRMKAKLAARLHDKVLRADAVLAVPRDGANLLERVEDAVDRITELDWKLCDVVVAVVRDLEGAPPDVVVSAQPPGRRAPGSSAGAPTSSRSRSGRT